MRLTHLCWVLMWFEVMLGLKMNLEKSELLVGNIIDVRFEIFAKIGTT